MKSGTGVKLKSDFEKIMKSLVTYFNLKALPKAI
jgi:hypothetical protein